MKKIIIVTFILVMAMCSNVWGYTGKGTSKNPFVVSTENDLRGTLTEHADKKSWIYIAVNDTITITKTINVTAGKYRIYAIGGNKSIKRSSDIKEKVNNQDDSKYCMSIKGDSKVVLGYATSEYTLILDGSRNAFKGEKSCSGFLHVYENASLTIGMHCHLKDAINNKIDSSTAPVTSKGELIVNGEISNCKGINGGAIKIMQGSVTINETAKIHDCVSDTEGGAIHSASKGNIVMNGGQIYNCTSEQEGGAIFLKGGATCIISSGVIMNNSSGESAGGVFAGYGATLTIGTKSGEGPEISYNTAAGSGGGIRCNGGNDENAGGTTYIYGGYVHHNTSGKYGGGIACGSAGKNGTSRIIIKNVRVTDNSSSLDGGGIWLPRNALGIDEQFVTLHNCIISSNSSARAGGGIMVRCSVNSSGNDIASNRAKGNGGGIYIDEQGTYVLDSGTTRQNICDKEGKGVYLKGKFKIKSNAYIDTGNNVYLTLGTFIDVIGKLSKTSGYIANINSKSKENGTILVKANYSGTTASKELYYSGNSDDEYLDKEVVKKYVYQNLENNRCLRSTEKVEGMDDCYIILSERYKVSYDKNTEENVENIPSDQIKFWKESINISGNKIKSQGCNVDTSKHWNTAKDGTGTVIKPGSNYNIDGNNTLYAQWLSWTVSAKDRYYVVGQDVELNNKEILKKVVISDNDDNEKYNFVVTKIKNTSTGGIYAGAGLITKQYMNTVLPMHYEVTFATINNENKSSIVTEMDVFVIEAILSKGRTRFISMNYINTLDTGSKWYVQHKSRLKRSLKKTEGDGKYKIDISNSHLKEIKEKVKENNYVITNGMNKQLAEEW